MPSGHRLRFLLLILAGLAALPRPALAAWTANGVPACAASGDQSGVQAIPDGTGGAIVVWVDYRNGGQADIYAQRITRAGEVQPGWPANGVALCTASGDQITPRLVSDGGTPGEGGSGAIVVWDDRRNGAGDSDIYAQRVTASGAVAWAANGVALCAAAGSQNSPVLVSDGGSGAIAAWEDYRGLDADVFAQHVTAGGTVAWAANGVALCALPYGQTRPAAVADGAGGVHVAWEDGRAGVAQPTLVYVMRLTSAGVPAGGWTVNGVAAATATGSQYVPAVATDGASGTIVVWEDYRQADADIYAQRLTAGGAVAPGWPAAGDPLCIAAGNQVSPVAIADGAGGAIVAWEDDRGGALDLYAQRVTAAGALASGWLATGMPVCTATSDQRAPQLVSDGAGGAVVGWYDYRTGSDTDIYAQRLTSDGGVAPGWIPNGTALCTAGGYQQRPAVVTDGGGGAIAAWSDRRSGANYDVYAQRVSANGTVAPTVDVPRGSAVTFRVSEPTPNPSAGVTHVWFTLPEPREAEATVFDLSGREVRALFPASPLPAGTHTLAWDGRAASGAPAAAGVYFLRVRAGSEARVRRIVRLE
ncbi:MAG: T9SS type A sorting domain-containing protein [Candidatus Eisenbacteria bacterium]|nr:T9SS type A sorting domain-containing protein [Candidatus Eisenbacteria bacterium]